MDKLYENIKKFRELKNLTRKQMATKVGLSVSGYSKIERGEIDLTISRINLISNIFKVDRDTLLNFNEYQLLNNNNHVHEIAKVDINNFNIEELKNNYIKQLIAEIERFRNTK